MEDLFNNIEILPKEVQEVLQKYEQAETYTELENMLAELKPLGYRFEYYLDAIPYNLSKIN